MHDSIFSHIWPAISLFVMGGGLTSFVSYAVDTWPTIGMTPRQLWILGMIKHATGHNRSGKEVIQEAKSLTATQQIQVPKN